MPRTYLNLGPALLKKVDALAEDRGTSRSETIGLYLALGIRCHEQALLNYRSDELETCDAIVKKKA
jgi:Ribbon-helix-helix protein, copG family